MALVFCLQIDLFTIDYKFRVNADFGFAIEGKSSITAKQSRRTSMTGYVLLASFAVSADKNFTFN